MARPYDPDTVAKAQSSAAWSAVTRTDLGAQAGAVLATWDPDLLREPRVLVPVDVQALVSDGAVAVVPLPGPLTPGAPDDPATVDGPAPFTAPAQAPAGVHLHWAMPDTLLTGVLRDPRGRAGGGLGMPALPDRWAVLRLLADARGTDVHVRGWLLDAAAGVVRDLDGGFGGPPLGPSASGRAVLSPAELTGVAGGSLTWTAGYHSASGRFAVHDPLSDLAADPTLGGVLSGGPESGSATYLVVGWWSVPSLDPLDGIRSEGGLNERTTALGWRIAAGGGSGAGRTPTALTRLENLGQLVGRRASVAAAAAGFAPHAAKVLPGSGVALEASTLLHGAVVGVPVRGVADGVDLRPPTNAVTVTFGEHNDDLIGATVAPLLAPDGGSAERRAAERLLSAFTGRLIAQLGTADGLVAIDEREHARGFAALDSGEPPVVDRVVATGGQIPPRPPRPGGRQGFDLATLTFTDTPFSATTRGLLVTEPATVTLGKTAGIKGGPFPPLISPPPKTPSGFPAQTPTPKPPPVEARLTERPAPPRHVPLDPVLAVSGSGRSLRHGGDGRASADGRLRCRRGSQVVTGFRGVVRGVDLLGSLASGALPAETLALAREALLLSPHLVKWLARFASSAASAVGAGIGAAPARTRLVAELALRYDATGAYTGVGSLPVFGGTSGVLGPASLGDRDSVGLAAQELLRRHSLLDGVEPDLVAITAWAQPWVPMWVEWEVDAGVVDTATGTTGWRLGQLDLEPADSTLPKPTVRTVTGRVPLTTAPGDALGGSVARWMAEENARDVAGQGEADPETQGRIAALGRSADALDLLGAGLDGVRRALLGLPPSAVRARDKDGITHPPAPLRDPDLVTAGTVTLRRARVVDAYGRVLDLDVKRALVPARLAVPVPSGSGGDTAATLLRSPRFTVPTRCALRFVDAAATAPGSAVDAHVDELDPAAQVSPVAGLLLADHIDESIEVFDAAGTALGELLTEPVGGGVVWEAAPGRQLPADAPPGADLAPAAASLGFLAAGIVTADAAARNGAAAMDAAAPAESALSALLRALDTTLWTTDPISGAGSTATGAIVGRPVAVVRTVLTLDVADDLDDLTLDDASQESRARAFRELAGVEVPVRIGELTRTDDGVLGWFVDDDFSRLHVVDRVVRQLALQAGRQRGHLAPRGETPQVPNPEPITHPYLLGEDELVLRPGSPRLVTLLMLPGLAAHVTSGVTPRGAVRMARAWFAAGLERLIPSIRVGPVLVDPGEVRLPLVAALGSTQRLTAREGPLGWRDDAILAATQNAVLPDRAAALREGWIRVDPTPPAVSP